MALNEIPRKDNVMDKKLQSKLVEGSFVAVIATVTAVVVAKTVVPAVERKLVKFYLTHNGQTKK
jgi:hypothetical protein